LGSSQRIKKKILRGVSGIGTLKKRRGTGVKRVVTGGKVDWQLGNGKINLGKLNRLRLSRLIAQGRHRKNWPPEVQEIVS